jgi:hypothetical protein
MSKTRFRNLNVAVDDGHVLAGAAAVPTVGELIRTGGKREDLGSLAGAQAQVTDGTSKHRVRTAVAAGAVFLPLAAVGLSTSRKAWAVITVADGTSHQIALKGRAAIRDAQAEAIRFNAMADAAGRS